MRVLQDDGIEMLVIDCVNQTMPRWITKEAIDGFEQCTEECLYQTTGVSVIDVEELEAKNRREAYARYTMIAGILPYIGNAMKRSDAINQISKEYSISKQTVRHYLCLYLAYMDISVLTKRRNITEEKLTPEQKHMRWALNKFYYTKNKNSLITAYRYMLQHKYRDEEGRLLDEHPSIHQFRYFYRKTKKEQQYYISREGIKSYQRNHRPLLGDGVQEFCPAVGTAMLDSTTTDIYVWCDNKLQRLVLTLCIDGYSGMCCGYSLCRPGFGGVDSLRKLMLNIVADKVEYCRQFGITIQPGEWNCSQLPGIFVTDMGREYTSYTFEQVTELGVKVTNLSPARPDLKSKVERAFLTIGELYKSELHNKGVVDERKTEKDYKNEHCLTDFEFEKILIRCILFYNNYHITKAFPYTQEQLDLEVKPCASALWEYGKRQLGANLINATAEQITFVLLPRLQGKFTKEGLRVNNLRYHRDGYKEQYLKGGYVMVAFDPENVSSVWKINALTGEYEEFRLIESRYKNLSISEVQEMRGRQKELVRNNYADSLQARIELTEYIETISNTSAKYRDIHIKKKEGEN